MSEKEGHAHAHAHAHKRGAHTSRGRPGHNRLYHHLGVRDLRELLDRKRSERGQHCEVHIPPPDPSYNYLKDPLRENIDNNPPVHPPRQSNTRKHYNQNVNYNQKRDGGNQSNHPRHKDIENPLNIKVEFSTSTGEHVYKIDESTVLPTIKHVPDQLPVQNRSFGRGRGRGRGRGQQRNYHNRTFRNNTSNQQGDPQKVQSEEPHITGDDEENWDDDLKQTKEENVKQAVCEIEELLDVKVEDNLEEELQNLKLDEVSRSDESGQKLEEKVLEVEEKKD